MTYFTLRLCANRGAFEAVPENPKVVDLRALRARLEQEGIPVVDARVMLIAQMEREVTFGRDGRVLIKSRDSAEAQRIFDTVRPMVEPPGEA